MKTYPLDGPPRLPGVYLLHNKTSGHLYVGQAKNLHRRWLEWRTAFSLKHQIRSAKVYAAAVSTDIADWNFAALIIADPGQDLNVLERRAIDHVQARSPTKVLNFEPRPRKTGSTPKTKIVDDSDHSITQAVAANLLGVTPQAVKKRLQNMRAKNITKVKVSGSPPRLAAC